MIKVSVGPLLSTEDDPLSQKMILSLDTYPRTHRSQRVHTGVSTTDVFRSVRDLGV